MAAAELVRGRTGDVRGAARRPLVALQSDGTTREAGGDGAEATAALTARATRRTRLARTAAATWVEQGDVRDKCLHS